MHDKQKEEKLWEEAKIRNNQKIELFKTDLINLLKSHNLKIESSICYDGQDEPSGTEYHFVIDGKTYYLKSFIDMLNEVVKR